MDVTTRLPLPNLQTPRGDAVRAGDAGVATIRALLRRGPVRFVIADVGVPLRWVDEADCYDEWKREIKAHVSDPAHPIDLENYPGEFAYTASVWDDGGHPIVVLSKHH